MIKKIFIFFLISVFIISSIIFFQRDKVEGMIKSNRVMYHWAKKVASFISISDSDKGSKAQSLNVRSNVTITVDVKNVIDTFKPFYNGIGMGTFNDGYTHAHNYAFYKLVGDMNKKMKFMNYSNTKCIFLDEPTKGIRDYGAHVYKKDHNGRATYYWGLVDEVIDRTLENGLTPIISLTFMPEDMASDPNRKNPWNRGIISPPSDYSEWKELIYQTVKHLKKRYGEKEIRKWYFEVWNEPDLFQFFWRPHPERERYPYKGDYAEYFKLYDYAVAGAIEADIGIKIGGPAIAGDVELFLKEFLIHCFNGVNHVTGEKGARVDFVSRHHYGYIEEEIIPEYKAFIDMIKMVAGDKFNDLDIIITETGPSTKPKDWLNDRYVAAWIIKEVDAIFNLKDIYGPEYQPDIMCFWTHPVSKNFNNAFSLVTALGNKHFPSPEALIKRPAFNGYQVINMLGSERLEINGAEFGEPVRGIATKNNDDEIAVILYSLIEGDTYNNRNHNFMVDLSVVGCEHPEYTFEYYGIDGEHSNAYPLWKKMGSPHFPKPEKLDILQSKDDLELLEPASKEHLSNGVFQKKISLQNNSVVLLKLSQSNDRVLPRPPRNLSATVSPERRKVKLSWQPPFKAQDGDQTAGYLVYRNGNLIAKQFEHEYIDKNLADDSEYHYAVSAVDDAGNVSKKTLEQKVQIFRDNRAPEIIEIRTLTENMVLLYFDEPLEKISASNIKNYSIQDLKIKQVAYDDDEHKVRLTTENHTSGKIYNLEIKNVKDLSRRPNVIDKNNYNYEFKISFVDCFETDNLSIYEWAVLEGRSKECQYFHESENQRLLVLVGDDSKTKFSHEIGKVKNGTFDLKFNPIRMYPSGGAITIYLKQDDENFYKISNTDGYGPGTIETIIAGRSVNSKNFSAEYKQNVIYDIHIQFNSAGLNVQAFNTNLSLSIREIIQIKSFEIELTQQDAYFDDFKFIGN